jgi:hypothetical protein
VRDVAATIEHCEAVHSLDFESLPLRHLLNLSSPSTSRRMRGRAFAQESLPLSLSQLSLLLGQLVGRGWGNPLELN